MAGIENYLEEQGGKDFSYAKINNNTAKVVEFVKQLHEVQPFIKKEFENLQKRQQEKPNEIFPLKMEALAYLWKAADPLYIWYVEKAPNRPTE